MAGGKETPRQKLIGMMYLVLTALLALQVSSSIMLKFKFLDDSLMDVNRKTITNNTNIKNGIVFQRLTALMFGNRFYLTRTALLRWFVFLFLS